MESKQWNDVAEHVPIANKFVLAYSVVHKQYYICKWSPSRGWIDQKESTMRLITHWNDLDLPFNWSIEESYDSELAKNYGIDLFSGFGN